MKNSFHELEDQNLSKKVQQVRCYEYVTLKLFKSTNPLFSLPLNYPEN